MIFQVSEGWKKAFPGAHAGVLVMHEVVNLPHHAELENRKVALEEKLRSRFVGQDRAELLKQPALQAYDAYYNRFKKTYHVQLQLESILFKGKSIPTVATLVEAMFMAEMADFLLTAGHDLDTLHLPATLNVSAGTERYTLLRGDEQQLKAGDMMISDQEGVISDVVYGPDRRTQITPTTKNVIFTTYAPAGIEAEVVKQHLEEIETNVLLVSPQARVEMLEVFGGE